MRELISKKTRYELAEYLSGFVLREIDHECEALAVFLFETHKDVAP